MKHLLGSIRVAIISTGVLFGAVAHAETKDSGASSTKPDAAKPDAKPKPRKAGQTEELKKAIDELSKEYKDYLAKPDSNSLRSVSDYFKGALPEGTTVEDVLTVCGGNTISGPVGQQVYVKWQLLSACPAKFDSDQVKLALNALSKSPPLVPAIGGAPKVKAELDRAIQGKKPAEVPTEVVEAFAKEQRKVDDINEPITGYRKALIQRLPVTLDTLLMGFQDLVNRLNAGADGKAFNQDVKALCSEAKAWATIDAKDGQVPQLHAAVLKLKAYKAPTIYYHHDITGKDAAKWGVYPSDFGKQLDDLETSLKDIKTTGGEIKFKDDDKDKKKK